MLGRYTESVSELRRAVELAPDVGDSHLNLGLSLIRGGWPAEGVEELRIARGLLPRDPLIEANLAAGYRALGEWGRARVHAEEALKMQPSDRDARLYLGESLLRMDDIDGARNVLEGLMRLAPGTPQANLAEELLKQAGGG
jgi:Flp pilus assembly protein TadD